MTATGVGSIALLGGRLLFERFNVIWSSMLYGERLRRFECVGKIEVNKVDFRFAGMGSWRFIRSLSHHGNASRAERSIHCRSKCGAGQSTTPRRRELRFNNATSACAFHQEVRLMPNVQDEPRR